MPFPRFIARINRLVTNRVLGLLAGNAGPFAMLEHTGRTSGKAYRTPIMAFRGEGGYLVALTYGPNTDWLKNIRAAGHCAITIHHQRHELTDPTLFEANPRDTALPPPVRTFLRLMRVHHFLHLTEPPTA